MTERPTLVGVLGEAIRADVDPTGGVAIDTLGWKLDWWIGADDRWRVPARETAVRQELVDSMPVVQTSMRVPGGDAVQRVYGAAPSSIVVEIANESPAPFVSAFVVRGARAVAVDDTVVLVDGRPALLASRLPSRWAVGRRTDVEVCSGAARTGPFPPTKDRAGRIEASFLHPVAHRTTLRVALLADRRLPEGLDPTRLPSAADVARGWRAHLERGMRVDLPDERLMDAVAAARAQALLAAGRGGVTGADVAALEDWGFDHDAAEGWRRLGGRERRRARSRASSPATWAQVDEAAARGAGPELLLTLRSLLAHESDSGSVSLLAELPSEWRGAPIEVHDAPTRHGSVSYAVRWHGARPALLWEAPPGMTLRAPGLDPAWSTTEARGDALLGEVVRTA